MELIVSRLGIGGQMLDACEGDVTFRDNAGVPDAGAVIDVLNLAAEIACAYNVLLGLTPPSATALPLVASKPPTRL